MICQGCYGEPIFNRFFGVALAYLVITLPTFPEPYTSGIFIDPSLAVRHDQSRPVSRRIMLHYVASYSITSRRAASRCSVPRGI
jgi:hypothetical protein